MKLFQFTLLQLVFAMWFGKSVYAQSMITGVPSVIPPSPEISALFRNLNFAVDHASGMGQINIPVFEIRSGTLSVPISISYNAGGRKVFDVTGPVGIGWSLNAGGAISRSIYGKPDDESTFPYDFKPAADLTNQKDYDYLARIYYKKSDSYNDTEYDMFSYYFGDKSGKFIVDHSDQQSPVFHLLPYQPLKITGSDAYPSTIVDDKGIRYEFGINERGGSNYYYVPPITCKLLTRIISADGKDTISFAYVPVAQTKWMKLQEVVIIDNDTRTTEPGRLSQSNSYPGDFQQYTVQRLTEIKFREGKVKFVLHESTDRVKTIQLLNNNNELIKAVEFKSSILDSPMFGITNTGTYKLDNVFFQDKQNATIEKYSFEYNPSPDFSAHDRDYWGYLNNSTGTRNITPVPSNPYIYTLEGPGGNNGSSTIIRGGDRTGKTPINGVLKKITYPTGGTSEFTYEMNKFQWGLGNFFTGGGLRVYQIKTTDLNGISNVKTYQYNSNGFGTISNGSFLPGLMAYEKRYYTEINGSYSTTASYRKRVYTSEFMSGIADANNDPVFYSMVTEYNGTPEKNQGKTVYNYYGGPTYGVESMGGAVYTYPSYPYTNLTFNSSYDSDLIPQHIYRYTLWKKIRLISTAIYKNNGDNTYSIQKNTSNQYKYTQTGALKGFHITKYVECGYSDLNYADPREREAAKLMGFGIFIFKDYEVTVGKEELEATLETDFTPGGSIRNATYYHYNEKMLPVMITTTSSKGDDIIRQIKYPADFVSDPVLGNVSREMINANMINYPVEITVLKGNTIVNGTRTLYHNWNTSGAPQIAPQLVQEKQGSGGYENRVRFYGYDSRNNIVAVSKENDIQKVYIWGYNKTYPVAEVVGAQYSTIMNLLNQAVLDNPSDDEALRTELNKIRTAFPSAQVTTYTYKPLTGTTSVTDINGKTVYYEYDSFGRLMLIRDQDKNILKKICYNYIGQQENCTVNTTAQWVATGNLRCAQNGAGQNTGIQEKEERDNNLSSLTHNQTRWIPAGTNTTSCPLPWRCSYSNCDALDESYRCVKGLCESGYRVYTDSFKDPATGWYTCTYHYEFSDGSWSDNYYEYNRSFCPRF